MFPFQWPSAVRLRGLAGVGGAGGGLGIAKSLGISLMINDYSAFFFSSSFSLCNLLSNFVSYHVNYL